MTVQCQLCPKGCRIAPGESGDCRIRVNLDGKLTAVTYGYPTAVHVDPVEKKPVYHFLPGTSILSLATVGCNLHCKNCQNWEISQANPEDSDASHVPPEAVPALARRNDCPSVAYTYTEPLAYYEYTLDCCRAAREAGLRNVLVSAGYINEPPYRELCRYLDAATIDVKSFSDKFYREICDGTLKPVLRTLEVTKALNVELEVSNLLVPTLNDTDQELRDLCRWLKQNLGADTPLHFLRFFPQYRLRNLPPTPAETLTRARDIARAEGMQYVYIGNLLEADAGDTVCPQCQKLLVRRQGFVLTENHVGADGQCPACKHRIYGVWK